MKQSLLLYLTILAVLFFYFYLYVLSKQVDFEKNRYKKQQKIKRQHRFSIQSVGGCQLFSLAKNENAQNYFDSGSSEKIIQYEKLIPVTEKLLISIPIQKGIPTLVKTKSE
jgi:hypothetical protein